MPKNKIHVLYHGKDDLSFQTWLLDQNVTIHAHYPQWQDIIEEMRKHGDPSSSHLFLHPGNYLGTWQRIDIPLFLNYEYCLLLDSDTIIRKPFTLAEFGLNMPYGIAMSSEMHMESTEASNAGIMLMNIPTLRRTYKDFLNFIYAHVESGFNHPCPSDQGAYLVYYRNLTNFLDRSFNVKPYWPMKQSELNQSHIIHFHGPKPHEYLNFILGEKCNTASGDLCLLATKRRTLCPALREFAAVSQSIDILSSYCNTSLSNSTHQSMCKQFLEDLATHVNSCTRPETQLKFSKD
jgi:lipopolysaccharide biosynthesis glycosyltransferase